jgi:hypothetical protein
MSITIISEQTVVAAWEGLRLRLATTKHSKIDGELRDVRLLVRDIVETTVSIETTVPNELHPLVRQRLTEIAHLQVYAAPGGARARGGRPSQVFGAGGLRSAGGYGGKDQGMGGKGGREGADHGGHRRVQPHPRAALDAMR